MQTEKVVHAKWCERDVAFGCGFYESERKNYGLHSCASHNIELCKRLCQKEGFCKP